MRDDAVQGVGQRVGLRLPRDHAQRRELNDEVHARPSEALVAPKRVSYLALLSTPTAREADREQVVRLADRFAAVPPPPGANHWRADLGPFRVRWERHTEFTRYTFVVDGTWSDPFAEPAIAVVPREWIEGLVGETIVASHAALVRDEGAIDPEELSRRLFAGNLLIGAGIAGGAAVGLTDFRIHADGFSRLLIVDRSMTPWQAGRMMQRLLEIETYRILALLALPVARDLAPALAGFERELAAVTSALRAATASDEPLLLERLTRLEAEIEQRAADNHYRFSAAAAYYELVQRRIAELREERIQGMQTFLEFNERRLAPAMNTCRAVAVRQDALSQRVARATQLLSTRVDITRERQNQMLLESMNRRAKLQLRLQQTVEGLSVAAITYYLVSLVGYAAKGLEAGGLAFRSDVMMALSIPLVAGFVWWGVRRVRQRVARGGG
jgi:uncharacterized membrane-anchored protein